MVALRNLQIHNSKKTLTKGEIIKLFGVRILETPYGLGIEQIVGVQRAQQNTLTTQYLKKGIEKDLFDNIWSCICFSDQPSRI